MDEVTSRAARPVLIANWPARRASLEEGVAAVVEMLNRLGQLDPSFSEWFATGDSPQAARRHRIERDAESVTRFVTRNMDDGTPRRAIEQLGFSFSAWNGGAAGIELGVSARWGVTSEVVGTPTSASRRGSGPMPMPRTPLSTSSSDCGNRVGRQ